MDNKSISEAHRIILQEIHKIRGKKKPSSNGVFIQCPWHSDNTPSNGVNLDPNLTHNGHRVSLGFFNCLSCGRKGHWNLLAKQTGLKQVKASDDKRKYVGDYKIDEVKAKLLGQEIHTIQDFATYFGSSLFIDFPKDSKWRGVDGRLLNQLDTKLIFDTYTIDNAILLPVCVQDELVGCIKAVIEKSEDKLKLSYQNSPGEWTKHKGLFPYDFTTSLIKRRRLKYCVLTEGARDALRLLQMGIPSLAILGTQNWGIQKLKLLADLDCHIIIMMDGDNPGVKATNAIAKDLKASRLEYSVIKLKALSTKLNKKVDPANAPTSLLRKLKQRIYAN